MPANRGKNFKRIKIAIPEYANQRVVNWRVMAGRIRGLHFKPDGGGYNIRFINDRQIDEAHHRAVMFDIMAGYMAEQNLGGSPCEILLSTYWRSPDSSRSS